MTITLRLDEDGMPLVPYGWDAGERMIEVAPGLWQEPTMAMIEKWLEPRIAEALARAQETP